MITLEWLKHHGACGPACLAFVAKFPSGNAKLSEVVRSLADHEQGLDWWNWLEHRVSKLSRFQSKLAAAVVHADEIYADTVERAGEIYDDSRKVYYAVRRDTPSEVCDAAKAAVLDAREVYNHVVDAAHAEYDVVVKLVFSEIADLLDSDPSAARTAERCST